MGKLNFFKLLGISVSLLTISLILSTRHAAASGNLYFSPETKTVAQGSTLSVAVRENSGSDSVNSVQVTLTYPEDKLDFLSIDTSSSAFSLKVVSMGANGSVQIVRGQIGGVTGDNLVAVVSFKVKASLGAGQIAFTNSSALVKTSDNTNIATSGSPLALTFTSALKIGDVNTDGNVDIYDLSLLLSNWGASYPSADLNSNSAVDVFDLSLLLSAWGK